MANSVNSKDKADPLYRVVFQYQDDQHELLSRYLYQSDLLGFIELEELVWRKANDLVDDPQLEKLKSMFVGVRRTFIPLMSILRIDEIDGEVPIVVDVSLESELKSNITHFPTTFLPPRQD